MLLSASANTKRVSAPLVLQTVIPFLPVPEITRSSTSPLPPVELGPRYNLPLVSKVAADIKSLKPVEPYKAKGIKEKDQYVIRKEGKKK